jgi:hypothetical protein
MREIQTVFPCLLGEKMGQETRVQEKKNKRTQEYKRSQSVPKCHTLGCHFLSSNEYMIIFFGGQGVLPPKTQGLMLARQMFYNLSHAASPFCSSFFE